MQKRVAIIGGGISGLTAAYYLQKAKEVDNDLSVTLYEGEQKLGGKMQTEFHEGCVIERGPDSFLARKTIATELCNELGLGEDLVSNHTGKSYVLSNGRLHAMPGGSVMGIPTQLKPFVFTSLFSPFGKMRAAFDFVMKPTEMQGDMALGAFFRRRVGNEVVDNLIEPLLSGIYAGDIDKMSLMATFPNFYQVEQKHGSLVRGMKKTTPAPKKTSKEGEKVGMFRTLKNGLSSLTIALENRLHDISILKNTKVLHVKKIDDMFQLELSTGQLEEFDEIIVCTPHQITYAMFRDYEAFHVLKDIPSTTVANVAMAFPIEAIKDTLDGTGFVVSRKHDSAMTACTWTHKKWPHTAPAKKALLRCYIGKPGEEELVHKSDEEITATVLSDLRKVMNFDAEPDFAIVSRWKESMPQYTVGHVERLKTLRTYMAENLPNMYLAGASYEGLGLPDCMNQGKNAALQIISKVQIENLVSQ